MDRNRQFADDLHIVPQLLSARSLGPIAQSILASSCSGGANDALASIALAINCRAPAGTGHTSTTLRTKRKDTRNNQRDKTGVIIVIIWSGRKRQHSSTFQWHLLAAGALSLRRASSGPTLKHLKLHPANCTARCKHIKIAPKRILVFLMGIERPYCYWSSLASCSIAQS